MGKFWFVLLLHSVRDIMA